MSYMTAALVGAFLLALRRDSERKIIESENARRTSTIPYRIILASVLSILSVFLINPTTNSKVIEPTKQVRLGTFTHAAYWWAHRDFRESVQRNIAANIKLAGLVPWNSSIVATEATAPLVSGRVKNVDYYPINLKVMIMCLFTRPHHMDNPL
jgi:hypothetical protein